MPPFGAELLSPETVQQAFIAAPPYLSQSILDLTIQHPSFLRDIFEMDTWPTGTGPTMQQLIFRGAMPPVERGMGDWKARGGGGGCGPQNLPDCSYNWTTFGGHGFDRKLATLADRDFRTPTYCVKEIQTTMNFKEVMGKIVENLYLQTAFFKEMNIGLNILTGLAKKFVIDAEGAKGNPADVYSYRNTGGVRLSTLNFEMLEFFFEHLRRIPDAVPYDVIDGSPIYGLMASSQLLARLYRDNTEVRQDVRFSSDADKLLSKYNFATTIRGQYIAAPILYPRRFNIVAGEPVEVLPFVNNVPAEIGIYTYLNPDYEAATHEEVLLFGKYPFKILTQPTEQTLGGGTDFGPEESFMNTWQWFNPATTLDPMRREGYFMTSISAGVSQQFSEGIYGIMVERPSVTLMAMYTPNPVCPVAPPTCTNIVPAAGCPCPMILSISANPLDDTQYYIQFAMAVTGVASDPVVFALDNGAYITGTLEDVSADGKTALVSFTSPLTAALQNQIRSVYCDVTLGCAATVESTNECRSSVTGGVALQLSHPIKAIDAGDIITVWFKDCTTASMEVVSVNLETLQWVVTYAAGFGPTDNPDGSGSPTADDLIAGLICDRGGITKVCVPPATDATCPACEASVVPCEP